MAGATIEREEHRRPRVRYAKRGRFSIAYFVTFLGPAQAIRCAGAIITATQPLGLQVRVGIHSGECEVLEDRSRGIPVHIAARVTALARPGEILVSRTVKDPAAGSGISFGARLWSASWRVVW